MMIKRTVKGVKKMSVMKARRIGKVRKHLISQKVKVNPETLVLRKGATSEWTKNTPLDEFKGVFSISSPQCDEEMETAHKRYAQCVDDERNHL